MAKAREYKTVRERAIALWRKEYDPDVIDGTQWKVKVYKSRSKKTITVTRDLRWKSNATITWSYKNGNLRRVS